MPVALYLYNSQDSPAGDFFVRLEAALNSADWDLQSDVGHAFDGAAGDKTFDVIEKKIREAHTVIFAVGPKGPGRFQSQFEAPALFRALQDDPRLRVLPILVGTATTDQMPAELTALVMAMDNTSRGGEELLPTVFRHITGQDLVVEEPKERRGPSSATEVTEFCEYVGRKSKNGLTLFVGPYAAVDVHDAPTPGKLGAKLLERMGLAVPPGELVAHPWIASEARRVVWPTRDSGDVWAEVRAALDETRDGNQPLPLDRRIAKLAEAWQAAPSMPSQLRWQGLLLVTTDQHTRLENALFERRVRFSRLRYSTRGHLFHETIDPHANGLEFNKDWRRSAGHGPQGTGVTNEEPSFPESVLVLKLMDSVDADTIAPLTTRDHLKCTRDLAALPSLVTQHLQQAPFVMLGGGLLDPLVALAFTAHFRPAFDEACEVEGSVPRYVAFDPSPGQPDMVRRLERKADLDRLGWAKEVFELDRIDWPLNDLMFRLTTNIHQRAD